MTTKGGMREGLIYPQQGIIRPTMYRAGEKEIVLRGDYARFGEGDSVVFLTVPHSGSSTMAKYVRKPRRTKPSIMQPSLRGR